MASAALARPLPESELNRTGLSTYYRPELDALRFIAFLAVFCFHASYLKPGRGKLLDSAAHAGAFGMPLFFVLSSFLITTLLAKERQATGRIHLVYFYARRVLRIWPLYLTFLLTLWLWGRHEPAVAFSGRALLAFLLFAGNWFLLAFPFSGPVMPLWSISLEEQFYITWPALFQNTSKKTFTAVAAALIPFSLASVWVLRAYGVPYWIIWWNTLPHLMFFGLGGLLALHGDRLLRRPTLATRVGSVALAGSVWVAGGFLSRSGMGRAGWWEAASYLCAALGCVLLFQAVWRWEAVPALLRYLGKISYGLYVFHTLSFLLAAWLLRSWGLPQYWGLVAATGFAITVALAASSYRWLELPFLRLKRRFEVVRSR